MSLPLRLLYAGTYKPDYARNRMLLKGLKHHGIAVETVNIRQPRWAKYLRLWREIRRQAGSHDVILIGFPGHVVVPLVWLAARRAKTPIIFDAFTSLFDAMTSARRQVRPRSPRGACYYGLDWLACRLADVTLLDTAAHAEYLARLVGLPRKKFAVVYAGSDLPDFDISKYRNFEISKPDDNFLVHFHGHYSPFQGVDVIVRAAKLLEDEPVRFRLVGRGQEYPAVARIAQELKVKNVTFAPDVDPAALSGYITQSDLCLGVFGAGKPRPVIPNKIYEALALGKPVLTARLPAMDELFTPNVHVAYCRPNDPEDLATQIRRLQNDAAWRQRLAAAGHQLYRERLTPGSIGKDLVAIIQHALRFRS